MPNHLRRAASGILPLALIALLAAAPARAQTEKIDRVRAFLIWEESGDLSKNVVGSTPRIEANGPKGMSSQIIVDIIVSGPKNTMPKGQLILYASADRDQDKGARPMVDVGWPITYFSAKGERVRSLIVDHMCQPFTLSVRVGRGNAMGRIMETKFPIFCGD